MPFSNLPQGNGDPGWIAYLLVFVMSVWGGLVNYLSRLRKSAEPFSWSELLFELLVSAFASMVTGLILFAFNTHWLLVLALSGIAGHAGGRTVMLLDHYWGAKLKSLLKLNPKKD
jgi:hypothetical protein